MRLFVTSTSGLMTRIAGIGRRIDVPARACASVVAGRWCARRAWNNTLAWHMPDGSLLDDFAATRAMTSASALRDPSVDLDVTLTLWPHPSSPDELVLAHIECEHDELTRLVADALELVEDDQAHPCVLDPSYPRVTYRHPAIEVDVDACAAEMLRYGGKRLGLDSITETKAVLLGAPLELSADRRSAIETINKTYGLERLLTLDNRAGMSEMVSVLNQREAAYARVLGHWND